MKKSLHPSLALALLAVTFVVFMMLNNSLFTGVRLDLTENRLYTLSEGTRKILADIDEPINLYYFFSAGASRDLTALRAYARQVETLLREYELLADGKINLRIIDPEPFSEEEDLAASFGLTSVPVDAAGQELYFGLAGTNALDDQLVIPFFQPDKEAFLEYELSKLVSTLNQPAKPVVGLMSSMKINGDINMQTFQPSPAWMVVDQLGQLFDIQNIDPAATVIDEAVDVLVIVHPKSLSEETRYAIDQFALKGGRVLAFVDPVPEQDRAAGGNPMMPAQGGGPSEFDQLLSAWGISLRPGQVVGDAQAALAVSGPGGVPVRHLAILGIGPEAFNSEDVAIGNLESLNFASAGILDIQADHEATVVPLVSTSAYSAPIDSMRLQFLSNPEELQTDFSPTGETYHLAVRVSGKVTSAFPNRAEEAGHVAATDSFNAIVVADTDLLADHMWVQVQNFFGQRIASPWADNGNFVINAVDNLVGANELISIRSRGRYARPFDVVADLRREAEARYLESANELQAQLAETERQLAELEGEQGSAGLLTLSPEQEAALEQFQQEKLRIRKQLRDVRHQLDKDIAQLGSTLKFINIALVPILLTLALMMINYLRMTRRSDS